MSIESVKVAGHRVLLKPEMLEEEISDGALKGFVIGIGDNFKREQAATILGEVVSIGKTCWYAYDRYLPNGDLNPDWEPWCKVGDKVFFAKHSGKFITLNDETYLMCNDVDIQGIYTKKEDVEDE